MHLRRLLLSLGVVGALCFFAYWAMTQDTANKVEVEGALIEGFDASRVKAVRLDNVERSLQMRVEQRNEGWFIVDPLEFPVEEAVLFVVLDALSTQRFKPAPEAEAAKVGLNPPRMVLDVEELVGTQTVSRRIEVGVVDLDPHFTFVRVDGRIGRTERGLDTTLDRTLHDWRSRNLWTIYPKDVVEVRRRGNVGVGPTADGSDVEFSALLDGVWRSATPFRAQLDPDVFLRWLVAASTLRAQFFIDAPGPLEYYGLDRPTLEIELAQADGKTEVLALAPEPQGEMWFAARRGSPHVFRVPADVVQPLAVPAVGLIDRELVRVASEAVDRIELSLDGRETVLTRTEKGWRVAGKTNGVDVVADDPADMPSIIEALGLIQRTRFDDVMRGRNWSDAERRGAVLVHSGEDVQGGSLGAALRTSDGVEGVLFRREGDSLVALVSTGLAELAGRDPLSWRSLELHKIPELEVARIELTYRGNSRAYARDDKGLWVRVGTTAEAREFAKLVDGVLSMRATELLPRGNDQLADVVNVRVVRYAGSFYEFALGKWMGPDGVEQPVYRSNERLARVRPELAAQLRSISSAD